MQKRGISASAQQEQLEEHFFGLVRKGNAKEVADFVRDLPGALHWQRADAKDSLRVQESPLHIAARLGHLDVAKELLMAGAWIDTPDGVDRTPLMVAAAHGHTDVLEHLLAQNPDINACEPEGATPLCFAAQKGPLEAARMLLDAGANPDGNTDEGTSPLFYAIRMEDERDSRQMLRLLLERGADDTLRYDGQTAAQAARGAGRRDLATFIEDYESEIELDRQLENYMATQHALDLMKSGTATPVTVRKPLSFKPR